MSFVKPGSPRGTFGILSSAAASTCFTGHIRFLKRNVEREVQLTDILVKEATRSHDDTLATSGNCMCRAYMCLRDDGYMDPNPLSLTCPFSDESVIYFTLRCVDIIDRQRGADRWL